MDNKVTSKKYKYTISFPHIGNYYIPIYNWLSSIIDKDTTKIMVPKKMSKHTIEIGAKYSPDFICLPFKYNLGNFIESLDNGANVLVQAGGGCKYGYYAELQKQILEDLGYKFKYITIVDMGRIKPFRVYNRFKKINPKLSFLKFIYRFCVAAAIAYYLDKFEDYMRKNLAYELMKREFNLLHQKFLIKLKKVKNFRELLKLKNIYLNKLKSVKVISKYEKNKKIRIGIIGELFTSMEQFSSDNIERKLNDLGAVTKRYTTITYLMVKKPFEMKKLIKNSSKYIKYELGADGTTSVAHAIELAKKGYDGIIHIKPFGCTPEENAVPILQKISLDYNIPIMYLTFDTQNSDTGVNTRLEAFYDMLSMKREKSDNTNIKGVLNEQ